MEVVDVGHASACRCSYFRSAISTTPAAKKSPTIAISESAGTRYRRMGANPLMKNESQPELTAPQRWLAFFSHKQPAFTRLARADTPVRLTLQPHSANG